MSYQVWRFADRVTDFAGRLDWGQWIMLSVLVLVVGFISLRGFGSRNNY
jgi:hypothetical protein